MRVVRRWSGSSLAAVLRSRLREHLTMWQSGHGLEDVQAGASRLSRGWNERVESREWVPARWALETCRKSGRRLAHIAVQRRLFEQEPV